MIFGTNDFIYFLKLGGGDWKLKIFDHNWGLGGGGEVRMKYVGYRFGIYFRHFSDPIDPVWR